MLNFCSDISYVRSYLFGIICGKNDQILTADQFIAGCNRFGVDSPCPTIIKKMSSFGNSEEMDDNFKRLVKKFKNLHPKIEEIQSIDIETHHLGNYKKKQMAPANMTKE